MKTVKWTEIVLLSLSFAFVSLAGIYAAADDHAMETVKEAGRDMKKETKKAARNVQDKTCTMVKGKLECAGEKAKHKVQNAADEVGDKVDDAKRK